MSPFKCVWDAFIKMSDEKKDQAITQAISDLDNLDPQPQAPLPTTGKRAETYRLIGLKIAQLEALKQKRDAEAKAKVDEKGAQI